MVRPAASMGADWDILTHIITYGYNDPLMVRYAKSRGVKLLQAFSGAEDQPVNDSAVRAKIIHDALSYAPPPYGTHDGNTSFAGLFFDIECTTEPCPWLYPERVRGMAEFFKELKQAWPTVFLSVYLSAMPGGRIFGKNGLGHPTSDTPFCAAGVECTNFSKGLCIAGTGDPENDRQLPNCSAAMSGGSGCPNCTAPLEYSAADVAPMVPYIDQWVYGGYSSNDDSFLSQQGLQVSCDVARAVRHNDSCGSGKMAMFLDLFAVRP